MNPVVFIHTNAQQLLAAKICAYSLKARSAHPDAFEIRLLELEKIPRLYRREGRRFIYEGYVFTWHNRDLQSHDPLRMMPPQAMGFQGRALVLDPDIFAVGDVYELLRRDMHGKSIVCRKRNGSYRGKPTMVYSTAVMLLDCSRLSHWTWNEKIDALFSMKLDIETWLHLHDEPAYLIGALEEEWNDLDTLTERTKLLHNTERLTQPWKTGLNVDFDLNGVGGYPYCRRRRPAVLLQRLKSRLFRPPQSAPRFYQRHPDPRQEAFFFTLLNEALEAGAVTEEFVHDEILKKHLRRDAFKMLDQCRATSS